MNNKDLVSVCIPTYNRSDLLRRAVESAVGQTYRNIEIIISDNCSSSEHCVKNKKLIDLDPRIRFNSNQINLGFAGNLNACIDIAKGKYILFLCDDDELLPEIVEKEIELFIEYPKVGLVHSDGYDCSFKSIRRNVNYPIILCAGDNAVQKIFLEMPIFFSSTIVKKVLYNELGYFTKTCSPDWEMWARIGSKYDIGFINEPLVKCYSHNISHRNPKEFLYEWNFLKNIIISYFKEVNIVEAEAKYKKVLGETFFRLANQAWREGNIKLGVKYIVIGFPYMNFFLIFKKMFKMTIKLPFSIIKFKLTSKIGTQTHV